MMGKHETVIFHIFESFIIWFTFRSWWKSALISTIYLHGMHAAFLLFVCFKIEINVIVTAFWGCYIMPISHSWMCIEEFNQVRKKSNGIENETHGNSEKNELNYKHLLVHCTFHSVWNRLNIMERRKKNQTIRNPFVCVWELFLFIKYAVERLEEL